MLAYSIEWAFGSIWTLKRLCVSIQQPMLKHVLVLLYQVYQHEHQSAIEWNSVFASAPCLPHGIKSIFVSGGAVIGRNCVLFQQVTIGSNTILHSKGYGAPVIGDNCYIGAGAKIIGKVRVGHNVRIGANAVVYQDVPDNSVVVSGEQRIIHKADMDNHYYSGTAQQGYHYYEDGQWIPYVNTVTPS